LSRKLWTLLAAVSVLVGMLAMSASATDYVVGDHDDSANNVAQCDEVNGTFFNGGSGPGSVPSTCTFTVEDGEEQVTFIINPGEVETGWHLKQTVTVEVEVSQGGAPGSAINPGEVTAVEVLIVDGGCYNPGGKLMKPGKGLCPAPDA
jgi:hypothetical protein